MRRLHHRYAPAVLALFIATSCSTYSGQKLGRKADGTDVVATGVPYNLVRAEYTLSRTPPATGAKDPTYALAVVYVPDPAQRYSLNIDPGLLKAPDFNMKFGAGGVLSGTTGTFTEQVTPFITAVGSFAASVIGAMGVFDKTSLRAEFDSLLKGKCTDPSDVIRFGMKSGATVSEELTNRILAFKDDDVFLAQFHYLTGKEHTCLKDVLKELKDTKEAQAKKDIKAWDDARTAFLAQYPDETAFIDRAALAVAKNDSDELAAMGSELAAAMQNAQAEEKEKAKQKEKQKVLVFATRARVATTETRLVTTLQAFVDADAATWRARHVLFLERQMEQVGLLVLQKSLTAADGETHLKRLSHERALTTGTVELQKRADELSAFIAKIKDKTVDGGTAPATAEYAVARAELDAVNAAIDARRARLLADAAAPTPPAITAFAGEPVKRVSKDDITASKQPGWFGGSGKTAPKYVLVLEPENVPASPAVTTSDKDAKNANAVKEEK